MIERLNLAVGNRLYEIRGVTFHHFNGIEGDFYVDSDMIEAWDHGD